MVNCTFCEEGITASSFCAECSEFLCGDCTTYHGRMKKSKHHKLQLPEEELKRRAEDTGKSTDSNGGGEGSEELQELKCALHKDEELTSYCVDCDGEVCSLCTKLEKHLSHKLLSLTECVSEFKEMMQTAMPEMTSFEAKTDVAMLDLEAKIRNTLGPDKFRLLQTIRSQIHKIQTALLQRELDIRKDLVRQTVAKAKELNIKRKQISLFKKKSSKYLELVPKYLEDDPHRLFSNRKWLTKDYFYLRGNMDTLLDEKKYKEYVEKDWYFHIGDGVLLETIMDIKALGSFVYTDGLLTKDEDNVDNTPPYEVPVKENSIESIFHKKYIEGRPSSVNEELNHKESTSTQNGNAQSSILTKIQNLEMEALETSVENEYIGFDILKELDTVTKGNTRISPDTTLASLLDEKVKDHPEESDRLSKYIADKTSVEDGTDSNSEYDPVLQTATGADVDKRRRTHSEESVDADSQKSGVPTSEKRRGRKRGVTVGVEESGATPVVAGPGSSEGTSIPQPTRKSSRFEVSPRPGLAVLPKSLRRNTASKDDKEKGNPADPVVSKRRKGESTASGGGDVDTPTPTLSPNAKRVGRRSGKRNDSPPRLTREVFLYDAEYDEEFEEVLGTQNESDGEGNLESNSSKEKKTPKKKEVSDEEYVGTEKEERRKSKPTPRRRKDPFLQTSRKRKIVRKKVDTTGELPSGILSLSMDLSDANMKISNYDANEDYCTVCLDGGENMICCDNCPKVFHITCHMPALHGIPDGDWQCIFCVEKEKLDSYTAKKSSAAVTSIIFPPEGGLNEKDFIYACKFIADIYALKSNLLIRSFVLKESNVNHGENTMCLSFIRRRLTLSKGELFKSLADVFEAVLEMKRQSGILYSESSEYGSRYKDFLQDFVKVSEKYFPEIPATVGIEVVEAADDGTDIPLPPPAVVDSDKMVVPTAVKIIVKSEAVSKELKEEKE